MEPIETILYEIGSALDFGFYYFAVIGSLMLPDICDALESANGNSTSNGYKAWVDKWMGEKYPELDGLDLWRIRCGIVHRSTLSPTESTYTRVLFAMNGFNHRNRIETVTGDRAYQLHANEFCRDMIDAVRSWYAAQKVDPNVQKNLPNLIRYHPNGIEPFMTGPAMIG